MRSFSAQAAMLLLPLLAKARTDLSGCISSIAGPSVVWYVPGTGELCEFVDCGGGLAPPKSVPGCPLYTGTDTVTASFLQGFGNAVSTTDDAAITSSATNVVPSTTDTSFAAITSATSITTNPVAELVSSTLASVETSSATSSEAIITSPTSLTSFSDIASFAISTRFTEVIVSSGEASSLYQISTGTASATKSNSDILGITTRAASSSSSGSATQASTSTGASGTPSTAGSLLVIRETMLLMVSGLVAAIAAHL